MRSVSADISIIMPCYNMETYLEQAIMSALKQRGVRLEIIAIDDGSTDGSALLLSRLAQQYPQFKILKLRENIGQSSARNIGLEMASGRYIAFLDADDFYLNADILRNWLGKAQRNGLDICIADYRRQTLRGRMVASRGLGHLPIGVFAPFEAAGLANVSQSWQMLLDRQFLQSWQLRFSDQLRQREDRLFLLEAMLAARRIGLYPHAAIGYRMHDKSTMQRQNIEQMQQFTKQMELLRPVLEKARSEGRMSADFERANAIRYGLQTLFYWHRILRGAYHPAFGFSADAKAYFGALTDILRPSLNFRQDRALTRARGKEHKAIRSGQIDLLARLLAAKEDAALFDLLSGRMAYQDALRKGCAMRDLDADPNDATRPFHRLRELFKLAQRVR